MQPEQRLGRQPIFNRDGEVFGFELLQHDDGGHDRLGDDVGATARMLVTTCMDAGIENLVGSRLALASVGRPFLVGEKPLPLPAAQFGLEVREGVTIDRRLVDGLSRLKRRGMTIVVNNFRYGADSAPLLTVADYVKLDVSALDESMLRENMRHLDVLGVKVIAERVEGPRELDRARALSAHLLQGTHLGAVVPESIPLLPLRRDVAGIVERLVHWPAPDSARLLRVIVQDPVLVYRMLRFINTATLEERREIHSVQEALEVMGTERLRGWAHLFRCARLDHPEDDGQARGALIRARICSLISTRKDGADPDEAFLAGLLMDLPAQLGTDTADIIDSLPVSTAIRLALAGGEGPLGPILSQAANWTRHQAPPPLARTTP